MNQYLLSTEYYDLKQRNIKPYLVLALIIGIIVVVLVLTIPAVRQISAASSVYSKPTWGFTFDVAEGWKL
ncbi:MAG: hypothetical protein AB1305_00065 [Candidatus Hadarchaeota archaeon]